MLLICGLGNVGSEYTNTRHNVGFNVVDLLAEKYNSCFSLKQKFKAEVAFTQYNQEDIILAKPLTYVNLSGQAIQLLCNYYKLPLEKIIVIHDDLELPCGKIKVKIGGSHAGHNGLKSIDQLIGKDYIRIRIGIDRPIFGEVSSYVLGKIPPKEKVILDESYHIILEHIPLLFNGQLEKFTYNTNQKTLSKQL